MWDCSLGDGRTFKPNGGPRGYSSATNTLLDGFFFPPTNKNQIQAKPFLYLPVILFCLHEAPCGGRPISLVILDENSFHFHKYLLMTSPRRAQGAEDTEMNKTPLCCQVAHSLMRGPAFRQLTKDVMMAL